MQQAAEVFEDVRNEFSSLEIIKERFEKWKFTHPASYSQAYMGLCLPKLFTPFVRLQMLDWHPVEVSALWRLHFFLCKVACLVCSLMKRILNKWNGLKH